MSKIRIWGRTKSNYVSKKQFNVGKCKLTLYRQVLCDYKNKSMLHEKVFHVNKNRLLLHKEIFLAHKSCRFFLQLRAMRLVKEYLYFNYFN